MSNITVQDVARLQKEVHVCVLQIQQRSVAIQHLCPHPARLQAVGAHRLQHLLALQRLPGRARSGLALAQFPYEPEELLFVVHGYDAKLAVVLRVLAVELETVLCYCLIQCPYRAAIELHAGACLHQQAPKSLLAHVGER